MANRRMNRRHFLRYGAASASALALAACGTSPSNSQGGASGPAATTGTAGGASTGNGGTLRVYWNPGHAYDAYADVIAKFEKDHPGWKVNLEKYQWPDMRTKILANFAADDVPDLVEEPGGWVQEFAQAGHLRSLQPYIEADGEELGFPADWQPYTVERNKVNGEVYGVQLHLTCALLFYNKDMLAEAGITTPPTTWEEFLETAKATAKGNVFGFAPNQSSGYSWAWLLQNGVRYYDPEKNVLPLDTEAAYEAFQFQADLIHKHKVAPIPVAAADYEGPQKLFSARRVAMIITGPWDIKPILDGSPDLNWGIAQALKRKEQSTFAGGTSLMIPKAAKNPDLAWELLKRFVALDAEIAATKEANMTMPRKSWSANSEVQSIERIEPFTKGLGYAVDVSAELRLTGKSAQVHELYNQAFQEILYKNRPAKDALNELVASANAILAE